MADDTLTPGDGGPTGEPAAGSGAALRRIEIFSRLPAAADALWQAIESRFRKKHKLAVLRVSDAPADVAVHVLAADDLTAAEAMLGRSAAPLKFAIVPAGVADTVLRDSGAVVLMGGEEALAGNVRAITRALRGRAPQPATLARAAKSGGPTKKQAPESGTALKSQNRKSKAADKAARREAKVAAKSARVSKKEKKPEPTAEELAAKAAEKAARREAKAAAKSARVSKKEKKPEPTAEELAAKAAEKAARREAKAVAKSERVAKKEKKPEPTAEELAAKAAEKAARREAKVAAKSERVAKKEKKPEPTPEELAAKAAAKAARREAKVAAKSARVSKKEKKPEPTPEELAAKAAAKAARREAKAVAKSERAAKKEKKVASTAETIDAESAAAGREARAGAKPVAKPDEKTAEPKKPPIKQPSPQVAQKPEAAVARVLPLRIAMSGFSPERARTLGSALEAMFGAAGTQTRITVGMVPTDVAIHAFDDPALGPMEIAASAAGIVAVRARTRIFVERTAPGDDLVAANRAIASLAADLGGVFLRLSAKSSRFGADDPALAAESILGVAAAKLPHHPLTRRLKAAAPDLVEARALAPEMLLSQLRWSTSLPPKSIWLSLSPPWVEAFADSKMVFHTEQPIDIAMPIDWSKAMPDRRTAQLFKGLEFLSAPLVYWYAKANGGNVEAVAAVDAALKARGATPNALLARATQIAADFIVKQPLPLAPDAWVHDCVERRARVALMLVLSAKTAHKRNIKFSEAACASIFAHLLDLIEMLRADDFYEPRSVGGVEQDCLLIGLGLGLRGTTYGNRLVKEGLERLKTQQLDLGLTAEGVWRGDSYATHGSVLSLLSTLLADFPRSDAAQIESFAQTAKKMTAFAEALLKSDGAPLAVDDSRQKSFASQLAAQRRTIVRAVTGGKQVPANAPLRNRITDTYVFREAQYFVSHSAQKVDPDSSLVVLHAGPAAPLRGDPGGLVLAFAHGADDLIVRAKPAEKVKPGTDRAPLYDPRLRNFYRVAGQGNEMPAGAKSARLVKSWRGPGWAAARSVEDTYANAAVGRLVVHLKAAHALVVVDELSTGDGATAEFEQFWNIAPDFAPAEPLRFVSAEHGVLAAAFADGAEAEIGERGGVRTVHRRLTLSRGLAGAIFQWTPDSAPLAVALEPGAEGWTLRASGKGFAAELALAGVELRCEFAL